MMPPKRLRVVRQGGVAAPQYYHSSLSFEGGGNVEQGNMQYPV